MKTEKIIAEVLNVDEEEISMETTFVDDLGADSLDVSRLSWVWRKNLILRFQMKKQRKLLL